jgi:hypothetical protein
MFIILFTIYLLTIYTLLRFVDRDMFMRFQGNAVGHKGMQEWDNILQCEGHIPKDSDDEAEDIADEFDEDGIDEEGDADEDEEDGDEDEDEDEGEHDILMDDDKDEIVADDGKELDDNILMEEGYGAL